MTESDKAEMADSATAPDSVRSQTVAELHLAALRRQFAAIREIYGEDPPHRAREALWVALEVIQAELRGERISLRDLVARANGLLSAPTLSRVVVELEQLGMMVSELTSSEQGRLKLLRPTPRALSILAARADGAFAEFAAILQEAERR